MKNQSVFFRRFAFFLVCNLAIAKANATEFHFKSKFDNFKVDVQDGKSIFNGQTVSSEPFKLIRPLFATQLVDSCEDKLGKPNLTISRKKNDKEEKRLVYVEKRIVSDGVNCGGITGYGIYQLPLHRNWFLDNKSLVIDLKDKFEIYKDGKLVVSFELKNGIWRNQDPNLFTNWTFFEQFLSAMNDLTVDFRVQSLAARDSTEFEIRQGKKIFKMVKVGDHTWAIKTPEISWYAASGKLGFLEDMNQKNWISSHTNSLRIISDSSADVNSRISAIRSLGKLWNPDIKYAYYSVITTAGERSEIVKEIATILRSKPTDDNFKTLIEVLSITHDPDLQYFITKILKLRNPKGPTILATDPENQITDKITEWKNWGKSLN